MVLDRKAARLGGREEVKCDGANLGESAALETAAFRDRVLLPLPLMDNRVFAVNACCVESDLVQHLPSSARTPVVSA